MANATHQFRAEVRKVLQILTHSLYTNREIFLRELLSNASDALDKLRFYSNRGESPRCPDLPLEIRITVNKDEKYLTLADTGIGMSAEELSENLGTIAKSGSEEFLAKMGTGEAARASTDDYQESGQLDAANIIGRFGIGFYAVFMVAHRVEVTSRPAMGDSETAHVWTSDGLGDYSIAPCDSEEPKRGTVVKIFLKDDAVEFLEKFRLESAIRNHSAFLPFPIFVDGVQTNTQPALWREPKFSVTRDQYNAFYKTLTYDNSDPLDVLHLSVDAPVQFNALCYIPASADDFFGMERDNWGLDLYAERVLIQRRNKDLLPEYLAFLKGVTDTEDLPLNISRETLQENSVLRKINQTLVKQTLGHLEKMAADDPEKYAAFWRLHGKIFKLGYHDYPNRERITSLLRFNSSAMEDADALTSLDNYIVRAPAGQKTFWYVAAPNREAARLSPYMDIFRNKGIEALYLFEPIDEFVMEGLGSYKEWDFKAIEKATEDALAGFADTEDAKTVARLSEEDQASFEALTAKMKEILGEKITEVRVSRRLADSPAVLVSADGGMTSSMEKLFKVMHKDDSIPIKILEVNRNHPLLRTLLRIFNADSEDASLAQIVQGLFDAVLMLDGYVKEPQSLADRSMTLLEEAAGWYAEAHKC
ncbi:MAG: molecular chaperone HtpG [Desulfovibrio sp.]|jgi:molecular chaperone HtpG|nr:molecular chaperone HtpG [Desulfovibrio sp.]